MIDVIINYFDSIPPLHRSLALVGGITFFWMLESAAPLFRMKYSKWQHAVPNIVFTLTTILVNFSMAFLLLICADWAQDHAFGILHWLPNLSPWLTLILGFMLLDLIGAYAVHWAEHKVKWMWRFHLVHHTDQNLDTTSANRHHPGESVFRFVFTCIGVLIIGAPMWMVLMYQSLSVLMAQFNHANIGLPKPIEQVLSLVFVTPDMHHAHHHHTLPYTDANYGNIFSIWDRLFGTFMTIDRDKLVYGIDTYPDPKEHAHLGQLFKLPFEPYRTPAGSKFESKS
jgi:sterol desaturase/sphingolipid hydroxylase (fatty acid hydroxylase superfamily)